MNGTVSFQTVPIFILALVVSACGQAGGDGSEADPANTLDTDRTVVSTADDPLDPDVVRQRFEDEIGRTIAEARLAIELDPTLLEPFDPVWCEEMTDALDWYVETYGPDDELTQGQQSVATDACNDALWTFRLLDGPLYDIRNTESIVSPFVADASVGFSASVVGIDPSGAEFGEPTVFSDVFEMAWAYQDGEWLLKDVPESEIGFRLVGFALLLYGLPPSESISLDASSGSPLDS